MSAGLREARYSGIWNLALLISKYGVHSPAWLSYRGDDGVGHIQPSPAHALSLCHLEISSAAFVQTRRSDTPRDWAEATRGGISPRRCSDIRACLQRFLCMKDRIETSQLVWKAGSRESARTSASADQRPYSWMALSLTARCQLCLRAPEMKFRNAGPARVAAPLAGPGAGSSAPSWDEEVAYSLTETDVPPTQPYMGTACRRHGPSCCFAPHRAWSGGGGRPHRAS